jgi:hypothetical protein
MKSTRKKKCVVLPSSKGGFVRIGNAFRPVGYYYNRPHIKNQYHQMEIGRIEGFRFIVAGKI